MSNIIVDIDNFQHDLTDVINKYSKLIPASIMNDKLTDLSRILILRAERQLKEAKAKETNEELQHFDSLVKIDNKEVNNDG